MIDGPGEEEEWRVQSFRPEMAEEQEPMEIAECHMSKLEISSEKRVNMVITRWSLWNNIRRKVDEEIIQKGTQRELSMQTPGESFICLVIFPNEEFP